ncbi:hypothetical protein MTX26_32370 [Bradyrhizobium sp. ISRA443]|uniref:hypothetical protein n=1 Tax=unclassified Bradyrhizobium TaxID=2631580 RepID=UPI00247ACA12|nr:MULTISPECIES: hypothetical protein [unclassified Bradyrhizobium]WGR94165.1 hypothetical protein MTX20_07395 [Bradyrhizobium sp. ISRA435]WGR98841.1 hypothetical protein MTX23_32350 [Bradyrhizobium sp. ISRA436]WGS05732.1 hypothetical protein MTX18_32370 [Bradyrhizobium sp. ISRA437]WGS12618.1 hypothetical protein MTX26_32370 [Bradyrhizobium sp. ISRA443]
MIFRHDDDGASLLGARCNTIPAINPAGSYHAVDAVKLLEPAVIDESWIARVTRVSG